MHRNSGNTCGCDSDLMDLFAGVSDPGAMARLFDELFTGAEIRDFALRWRLMRLLHEGMPQRAIASRLRVSLCKITRGARVLKNPESLCRQVLDKKHNYSGPQNRRIGHGFHG